MFLNSRHSTLSTICAIFTLIGLNSAQAAMSTARSEFTANNSEGLNSLLEDIQLSPVTGASVINSKAGFNIGAAVAYRLLDETPLYLEPSFVIGIFSGVAQFNFGAGARYDILVPDTNVRPFFRASLGPTFQTSGSVAVFNALAGAGAIIPMTSTMDFRAEVALININGNAGAQLLTGLTL
jgi:hypothetical protein